jgi:hypothetical protein
MALAKLEITRLDKTGKRIEGETFKVLFNPTNYTVSKSVSWSPSETDRRFNAPPLSFGGGGSRQLTLNLFYDVTEPINDKPVNDVRKETNKLVALSRIERDLGQPPVVELSWGEAPMGSDFPFTGVVSSLSQTFILFTHEGTPVRANVSVTFTEFLHAEMDLRETDPELTTHRIKRGDSLSGVAASVYRDPRQWRVIADANRIDDPRGIEKAIGQILTIPDLR